MSIHEPDPIERWLEPMPLSDTPFAASMAGIRRAILQACCIPENILLRQGPGVTAEQVRIQVERRPWVFFLDHDRPSGGVVHMMDGSVRCEYVNPEYVTPYRPRLSEDVVAPALYPPGSSVGKTEVMYRFYTGHLDRPAVERLDRLLADARAGR